MRLERSRMAVVSRRTIREEIVQVKTEQLKSS